MTRASVGADSSLAGRSLISIETDTLSSRSITESLIGALHVCVSSVGSGVVGETLKGCRGGPLGLDIHSGLYSTIVIQVSLRSLNEGDSILTGSLRAISTSPVTVACASIIGTAGTMTRAHVVAFSSGIGGHKSEDCDLGNLKKHFSY